MKQQMTAELLKAKFDATHVNFRINLSKLSVAAKCGVLELYAMWRKYAAECQSSDQSPLLWEFTAIVATQIGVNRAELLSAIA